LEIYHQLKILLRYLDDQNLWGAPRTTVAQLHNRLLDLTMKLDKKHCDEAYR